MKRLAVFLLTLFLTMSLFAGASFGKMQTNITDAKAGATYYYVCFDDSNQEVLRYTLDEDQTVFSIYPSNFCNRSFLAIPDENKMAPVVVGSIEETISDPTRSAAIKNTTNLKDAITILKTIAVDPGEDKPGGFVLYSNNGQDITFKHPSKYQKARFEEETVPFVVDYIEYRNHAIVELTINGQSATFTLRKR